MDNVKIYSQESVLIKDEVLGAGSFAVVWLGELRDSGEKVAVKKPRRRANNLENVMAEIRTSANLNHENVVKLLGIMYPGSSDTERVTLPWIITEHMEHGNLHNFMKHFRRFCNKKFKIGVTLSVASAMKYLHVDHGIVHGDLHSNNCLISDFGRIVKVADFGLSFKIRNEDEILSSDIGKFGRPNGDVITLKGARWKPAEWVPGKNYHSIMVRPSDVWCYGILLFELWNDGRVSPFKKRTDGITSQLVARGYSPLDFHNCVGTPPPFRILNIMHRCFNFVPTCRPTFTAIVAVLRDAFPDFY